MSVLDAEAGRREAEAAIRAVAEGASEELKQSLKQAIRSAAIKYTQFSGDQVWVEFKDMFPTLAVPEPRVLGPLMRSAEKSGLCKSTGKTINSERPARHTGKVTVYRSLLCASAEPDDVETQLRTRIVELEQEVVQLYRMLKRTKQK